MHAVQHSYRWGELVGFLLSGVLILLLWRVPYLGALVYPFRLLGTFVHELSHGMAALLTGGSFQRFTVSADLSGLAWSAGGWRWLVCSAGYVGSAAFGGALLLVAARGVPARVILAVFGILLAALCLLFVRNVFGVGTGLLWSAALVLAGWRLTEPVAAGALTVVALQLILDAFNSLLGLIALSTNDNVRTDALSMADATGVPALLWACAWALTSVAILIGVLRATFRRTGA